MSSNPSTRDGFTLLEVVAAMLILALGIMASAGSMVSAVNVNTVTNEKDIALQAMESRLEDILTATFTNAEDYAGDYPVDGLSPPTGRTDVLIISVTPLTGFESEYKVINLEAVWDGEVATETMTLTYGLSNRGG